MSREQQTIKKIQELVPGIIQEFKEEEQITERIGSFIRQSACPTVRINTYERDITLEDVLLAIKRNNKILAIDSRGNFLTIENSDNWYYSGFQWQLNKPFSEQSQECKNFIGNLILK